MKKLHVTKEWDGHGKNDSYWNEYRLEEDEVVKYKCSRSKFFDGKENEWQEEEKKVDSWDVNDDSMPDWLKKKL